MNLFKKIAVSALMTAFVVSPTFAYGGGGGGGSSSVSFNTSYTPSFTAISPAKNSVIENLNTLSFEVSKAAAQDSIVLKINDEVVETTILEKADGSFVVTANPSSIPEGTALISLYAESSISSSYRRNYIYPIIVGSGDASTLPETDTTNTQNQQNRCSASEVSKDGIHDTDKQYSDIAGDPNAQYIKDLTERCIVHGISGTTTFEPTKSFNRAAATKTVVKAFGYNYSSSISTNPFGDVKSTEWFAPYILTAKNSGIIKGYAGGNFRPAQTMNIAEGLAIVARASGADLSPYNTSGAWYNKYLAWGEAKGLINTGTNPGAALSRGTFARMVSQAQ